MTNPIETGVNIELGDDVSKMLYEASKVTWSNRPDVVVEMHPSFSGWRAIRPDYKPNDCYEGMGSDGIGTKVEIAERTQDHTTIAFDLFAMACDDAAVRGAEPVAINTVLDVNKLRANDAITDNAVREMAIGYIAAAQAAGVVILNGETAELGYRIRGYGDFNYNWCATVLWYAQQDRILTGHKIKAGHALVGLAETGFRSNGITDVRAAMIKGYGKHWQGKVDDEISLETLGAVVQQPSTIYSKFVNTLTGGFDIDRDPLVDVSGVAHITGGGQPSKLGRMLEPTGLGAELDDPIDPPPMMTRVQSILKFEDEKAYGKWHMGSGMVIATPDPEKVLAEAEKQRIEAKRIGTVTEESGIRIKNRGAVQNEEWLSW